MDQSGGWFLQARYLSAQPNAYARISNALCATALFMLLYDSVADVGIVVMRLLALRHEAASALSPSRAERRLILRAIVGNEALIGALGQRAQEKLPSLTHYTERCQLDCCHELR